MKNIYTLFIASALLLISQLGLGQEPSIQNYAPENDATNVPIDQVLSLEFDGISINPNFSFSTTVKLFDSNNNTILSYLFANGQILDGTFSPADPSIIAIENGTTLKIAPPDGLSEGTSYYITIAAQALWSADGSTAFSGIDNIDPNYWRFSTLEPPSAPTVATDGYSPSVDASGVDNSSIELTLTFNENIKEGATGGWLEVYRYDDDVRLSRYWIQSANSDTEVSVSGTDLIISDSTVEYDLGTKYYVTIANTTIQSTASDLYFEGISDKDTWFFTTVYSAPITTIIPTNGATDIYIGTDITIDFDQAAQMTDGTTLIDSNLDQIITFTQGTTPIPYTATINEGKDQIIITPDSDLTQETVYNIEIAIVESISGNIEQESPTSALFTTEIIRSWTGLAGSNDITDDANWNIALPTGSSFSAIIQPADYMPIVTGSATLNKLTIEAGASVEIESSGNVTINDSLVLKSSNDTIGNGILFNKGNLFTTSAEVIIHQQISSEPYDYYISSPVTSATPESVGVNGQAFRFIPDQKWEVMNSTDTFNPAEGYVVWSTNDTDLQFKGTINNAASYTFNCLRTTSPYKNFGWNLIGNPYPCAIDLNSLDISDNMNYHFQLRLNNTGQLGVINESGSVNLNDHNTTYLPSMHSAWVQVNIDYTEGSVIIPDTARINYNYSYLKSTKPTKPSIKLAGINSNGVKDETLIAFNPDISLGEGTFDSEKVFMDYNQSILELYSVKNNTQLAINTIAENIQDQTIDLGFYAPKAGTYSIKLAKLNNTPDIEISIEDKANSTETRLSLGDSYSFTTEKGNNDNRFVLHLNSTSTSVQEPVLEQINIYNLSKDIYIEVPELVDPKVEIYDTAGKLLIKNILNPSSTNHFNIEFNGIVIVKVISKEKVFSQKLLIK